MDMLYERLREHLTIDRELEQGDRLPDLYTEIDAVNKEKYRSGRGRRLAERELLSILVDLPKKDVLELLELAKMKKRWQ